MTRRFLRGGVAEGTLTVPGSKSYTHRALMLGALAARPYRIAHPLAAEDTLATARGLGQLGYAVDRRPTAWEVRPGRGPPRAGIDCGSSGTTLRFLLPFAARGGSVVSFRGDARLRHRPIEPLLAVLRSAGVGVRAAPGPRGIVTVRGPLRPVEAALDPSGSSQFASALLLTLPSLPGPSHLRLTAPEVSRPYIDATRAALAAAGIRIRRRAAGYDIPAPQGVRGRSFRVPGDASSAAYLWAAAAASGGDVTVHGIAPEWPQADLALLPWLRRMGATVRVRGSAVRVRGRVHRTLDADLSDAPDLLPLLAGLAAIVPGRSVLRGAAHAEGKESDRFAEAARLAGAVGGSARRTRAGLLVRGTATPRPFRFDAAWDHRVVMSAAAVAAGTPGRSVVGPAEAVRKSYPGFWEDLAAIGMRSGVAR